LDIFNHNIISDNTEEVTVEELITPTVNPDIEEPNINKSKYWTKLLNISLFQYDYYLFI